MKQVFRLFILLITFSVWSCTSSKVATDEAVQAAMQEIEDEEVCGYDIIEGKGTITQINRNDPNNVVIKFDFMPNKKRLPNHPKISNQGHLFNVDGLGKYPTIEWCDENGIERGATFACIKYELDTDSNFQECEHVTFSFTEFEGNSWK